MKLHRLLLCLIALSFGLCALGSRAQQPVTFPSGDSTGQGLLYLPHGAGPHPALVVIHEWWGLNDWVKHEAAGYAAQGYVTLAVDLYRGRVATTMELAHELSRGLPQDQGVRDLTSAVDWLAKRSDGSAIASCMAKLPPMHQPAAPIRFTFTYFSVFRYATPERRYATPRSCGNARINSCAISGSVATWPRYRSTASVT